MSDTKKMADCEADVEKRIIETARRLFAENGYEDTCMNQIAAQVGMSRPTLYYHFRTKEKLYQAVFGDIVSLILPRLQVLIESDLPFFERVSRIIDMYIEIFSKNPMLPRFVVNEVHRDVSFVVRNLRHLALDEEINKLACFVENEMEQGHIKRVPLQIVFMTFYSQLIFPFLVREMYQIIFQEGEADFIKFLGTWKKNMLSQMRALLEV
ncbi:MAG: TetR/AcrR family transcriptional regulator [Bacteroidaceae bacterium]|jgi:TetR/AcrR family transcriptional regulator